jgi:hypothetical protein
MRVARIALVAHPLRRSIRSFRCDPISRERRGIDFFRRKIGVPYVLPLEPLARHPLITHQNSYLIQLPLHLLDPPLTQPGDAIAFLHRAHMFSHCLKNCGVTDSSMGLHHRQCFRSPMISHGIQRRWLHPEIIEHAQHEHCYDRIVNDLHSQPGLFMDTVARQSSPKPAGASRK